MIIKKINIFFWQIGKTKFNRAVHFEWLNGVVPYLTDKKRPGGESLYLYPSIYTRGEVAELPAWISYDKQVNILTFVLWTGKQE